MFGLPNDHPLSTAVAVLVQEHEHTTDVGTGLEQGLLLQLDQAIGSSTAGAPGGGQATGSPVNLSALTLRAEIADTINRQLPVERLLGTPRASTAQRLRWLVPTIEPEYEGWLLDLCESWADRIRELLTPSRHVPLRGQSCPECKCLTYPTEDPDGGTVLSPPLVAHLSEPELRIECLACGHQWTGATTIELYFSITTGQTFQTT